MNVNIIFETIPFYISIAELNEQPPVYTEFNNLTK